LRALRQISQLLPNLELYVLSEGFYHVHLGLLIQQRPSEDFLQ
jgi:CRISPR-associated endonuclease/helicase Cas3